MSINIGSSAYNPYSGYDDYSYKCIKYLMENNELVWKLLKYKTPDAYSESNLTKQEKGAMIYNGSPDSTLFNVFLDGGSPDVLTREDTILRVVPYRMFPDNRTIGTVSMNFEVYAHYKVNTLDNYKTRVDLIINELITLFNGVDLLGIGKFYFNYLASQTDKMREAGQIPFKGKQLMMSTRVG